ncbi:mechanosensitive ion channel family protein [Loktanella salsilacus]|jgi:small-conductance mechanosensitive channel|uniref:Mechanosensitive ion channel n=1 Tax=Loktanella salsilacus TaxID=195913 RepID=A0A1I4F1P5_9RHOB|nr:mechanosensitive ion channel domain-containing protein [Loktanella salsilacus]MBU0781689.1 mechanosensitive ion channel [Alphaproteobacteria bacterium]MBU1835468.1 mechanosensitive ion channel [Alphaproteobacteria bacterium]UTH48176.1 mechanosensitive ion channel [Loktanella salsilacus]SFL11905.1 Mechanosensitive ion channel [Loktanella salsilacus]|tara:strand:- start:650 stop:2056 length:1407 start_codon:yes stop_codon:yes gene_type:complete
MALHDDLLNTSVSAPLGDVLGLWQGIIGSVESYVMTLWRPWVGYQLLIALAVLLVAQLLKMVLAPRLHAWMRAREGWPMWRIRWLVVLHKRLRGILFVGMIWLVVIVMRDLTWNSRSYQLSIIANLATAWLVVALTTRLIGNPILRKAVRYGAWVWVTLSILGQTDTFTNLMDNIAFSIGTMRISVLLVVQAILILGVLWFAARFMSHTVRSRITGNADISPSMQVLAVKAMQLLFYGMAVFIGLKTIGIDLTGLAVLSGAIGVGLGFGLQKVVSNLVSGIILLLDKSIKPGDVISLGDTFGWINSLGARYVSITTRDGKEYLIPNEDLITGQVVNWSHSNDFVRLDIYFGTAYGDNPHDVRRIAIEAAMSVPRVLESRPTVCHIVGFGDSSVDYILRFWISDPTGGLTNIRGNVFLALWDAFAANGISIPFPQREVKVLEGSELRTRPASSQLREDAADAGRAPMPD